jgi:ankyrin repeat protein
LHAKNDAGETPLHLALSKKENDVANLLRLQASDQGRFFQIAQQQYGD